MKQRPRKIGIVVPAYNEEKTIKSVLASLPKEIASHPTHIIVVNDGSADATSAHAINARATVINHIINMGPGAATRTGIDYARQIGCDVIATIDADGQHMSDDLARVVKAVLNNTADVVIGSRLLQPKGMVLHRLIGNIGLSFFTYLIFGAWVTDSQSGLKAFNAKAADSIQFNSNDFGFCSEIIWRAKQQKLRLSEVPIKAVYTEYSLSKGQSKLNGVHMLTQMMKQRIMGLLDG